MQKGLNDLQSCRIAEYLEDLRQPNDRVGIGNGLACFPNGSLVIMAHRWFHGETIEQVFRYYTKKNPKKSRCGWAAEIQKDCHLPPVMDFMIQVPANNEPPNRDFLVHPRVINPAIQRI